MAGGIDSSAPLEPETENVIAIATEFIGNRTGWGRGYWIISMEATVPVVITQSENSHIALTLHDLTRFLISKRINKVELPAPVWSFFISKMPAQYRFVRESEPRVHFLYRDIVFFLGEP